jgi:nucleoside 2-deoxyribosyltransferase
MATEAALTPEDVYSRDIAWIRECDVLIAEVSTPSHGVGYELGFALGIGKPVLALCRKDRKVTKMINGNPDKNLRVKLYTSPEEAIHSSIRFLSQRN